MLQMRQKITKWHMLVYKKRVVGTGSNHAGVLQIKAVKPAVSRLLQLTLKAYRIKEVRIFFFTKNAFKEQL